MVQRRKRLLDTEMILDAALACVEESGRLTMADLAARLGASASSIYHHLPGRAAIIEALRHRIVATVDPPDPGDDWVGEISRWMRSYREAFARHPTVIALLVGQTMTVDSALRGYDRVAALLRVAGVPAADIVPWISVLDSYALGSALDLAGAGEPWPADPADLPELTAAIEAAPHGRARADRAFDLGLAALLAGIGRRM
ncbi:TetR/AcrR family transcriptional regulator C-terminal domain-containing protein [Nocardia terpenica]|uniref:TetR/AcrR family transcriptional regulator n=1 Tax=Nocardia terpenica TaxID=455432 RepID=UPI001896013C|nr:TetR/AcrR family transcriptional regulator [Nocardia terpenica]MBF6065621.1 TetR/AcrR family transcriptional regulator C-terminal domain-containing protein [Nocardia terpenica]MBF6115607.1 TetR/AcrR family transcriptional regulator C-terminal domain-containing protein [Nocardia terpenica]MBF6122866.1 TetR/AcrR family transcriptional regulator C-terminal domain-containing protein [Nocardia terpenica]MBF6155782.1 TetR/AcrR family transcriptional regulator C-terminal domain-containing protein [